MNFNFLKFKIDNTCALEGLKMRITIFNLVIFATKIYISLLHFLTFFFLKKKSDTLPNFFFFFLNVIHVLTFLVFLNYF